MRVCSNYVAERKPNFDDIRGSQVDGDRARIVAEVWEPESGKYLRFVQKNNNFLRRFISYSISALYIISTSSVTHGCLHPVVSRKSAPDDRSRACWRCIRALNWAASTHSGRVVWKIKLKKLN